MSFFEEIGKKVTQVGNDTVKMTKDFSEITKLNSTISSSEKTINDLYMQIGKKYYEENSENAGCEYANLITEIKNQQGIIKDCKEKVCAIKGVTCCENCGSEVSSSSAFCPDCGTKLEKRLPAGMIACPGCGETIECDSKFCAKCGTAIKAAAAEEIEAVVDAAVEAAVETADDTVDAVAENGMEE